MIDCLGSSPAKEERPMDRSPEKKIAHLIEQEPGLSFLGEFLRAFPQGDIFLVGGAVRDAVLGRGNEDFDFVVRNIPREKMEEWFEQNGRVDWVGSRFGIYKFSPNGYTGHIPIDIALPRTEHPMQDSFGGARDIEAQSNEQLPVETDLSRRDFTFNAMAFDTKNARIIDPFNGMDDLKKRLVRAVGEPEARFREDLSRLLRAIRFASQLGCEIESETWNALREKMPEIIKKRLRNGKSVDVVPRDVIGKEIAKAMKANPWMAVNLLQKSNAIRALLPSLSRLMEKTGSTYTDPLQKKPLSLSASVALLLRGLPFLEINTALKESGLALQQRKNPIRIESTDVEWVVHCLQMENLPDPVGTRASEFERMYFTDRGASLLEALSALQKTRLVETVRERMKNIRERLGVAPEEKLPPTFVSGNDILSIGINPGPEVRFILLDLRDAQLDGFVHTRTEALEYLKKISQKTRNETT